MSRMLFHNQTYPRVAVLMLERAILIGHVIHKLLPFYM